MSKSYQFSQEEISSFAKERKVKAMHKAILYHRQRYTHLKSLKDPDQNALDSILVLLKIYGWEVAKLDPKFFNDNLAILPGI